MAGPENIPKREVAVGVINEVYDVMRVGRLVLNASCGLEVGKRSSASAPPLSGGDARSEDRPLRRTALEAGGLRHWHHYHSHPL